MHSRCVAPMREVLEAIKKSRGNGGSRIVTPFFTKLVYIWCFYTTSFYSIFGRVVYLGGCYDTSRRPSSKAHSW